MKDGPRDEEAGGEAERREPPRFDDFEEPSGDGPSTMDRVKPLQVIKDNDPGDEDDAESHEERET